MQKRRERIERWRAERKKKELDSIKKDVRTTIMCKLFILFYYFFLKKKTNLNLPSCVYYYFYSIFICNSLNKIS